MTQTNKERTKQLKVQRELWRDLGNRDTLRQFLQNHVKVTPSLRRLRG